MFSKSLVDSRPLTTVWLSVRLLSFNLRVFNLARPDFHMCNAWPMDEFSHKFNKLHRSHSTKSQQSSTLCCVNLRMTYLLYCSLIRTYIFIEVTLHIAAFVAYSVLLNNKLGYRELFRFYVHGYLFCDMFHLCHT